MTGAALNHRIIAMAWLVFAGVIVWAVATSSVLLSALASDEPDVEFQQRIALVIGNGAYADAPLRNPASDARLMTRTLVDLGFVVIESIDVGQAEMKRAILDFGLRLEDAGPKAVGLFYFGGHGVQLGGRNFLIPVDARIRREADVDILAVDANWVLAQMEFARNSVNIVILDACRNNPYTRDFRALSRGLARMSAPRGTLIAYSTRPGSVAADGTGDNSPYTSALTRAMQGPGLSLSDVFIRTRVSVMAATDEQQVPWEEGGLTANFYFTPDAEASAPVTTTPAPTPRPAQTDREALFWQSIQNSSNPADFEAYLAQYPDGTFARLARNQLSVVASAETKVAAVVPRPRPEISIAPMDEQLVALKNANVRSAPSTDGDKLDTLTTGAEVTVTGKVAGANWYRIARAGGSDGYVYAPLLGEPKPVAESPTASLQSVPPAATRPPRKPSNNPGDVFRDCADCPGSVAAKYENWNPIGTRLVTKRTGDGGEMTITFVIEKQTTYGGEVVHLLSLDRPWSDPGAPCDGANQNYWHRETLGWVACLRDGKILASNTPHNGHLRFPLKVGDTWTAKYIWTDHVVHRDWTGPMQDKQFVAALETVTVPAGTFEAFKVNTIGEYANGKTIWYAPSIRAIVREVYYRKSGNGYGPRNYSWELVDIQVPE